MARLVFRGEGARDGDVLEHGVRVEAKALGDRLEALGAEGALGVDDHALAVGAAVLLRGERAQGVLERARRREARTGGSCVATASVWLSCDLPVRNSPKTSVMQEVSMPPPRRASRSRDPVVICVANEAQHRARRRGGGALPS